MDKFIDEMFFVCLQNASFMSDVYEDTARRILQLEFEAECRQADVMTDYDDNNSVLGKYCIEQLRIWLKLPVTVYEPGAIVPLAEFTDITTPSTYIIIHTTGSPHALFVTVLKHCINTLLWPIRGRQNVKNNSIHKKFYINMHVEESLDVTLKEVADYAEGLF